jgi:hypothetical protein
VREESDGEKERREGRFRCCFALGYNGNGGCFKICAVLEQLWVFGSESLNLNLGLAGGGAGGEPCRDWGPSLGAGSGGAARRGEAVRGK